MYFKVYLLFLQAGFLLLKWILKNNFNFVNIKLFIFRVFKLLS